MTKFQSGEVKRTYSVQQQTGVEDVWAEMWSGSDAAEAERVYEGFRNEYPNIAFRSVAVIQHVERVGRGKVYL